MTPRRTPYPRIAWRGDAVSAMPAAKLRGVDDLYEPPQEILSTLQSLLDQVAPELAKDFFAQLLPAFHQARQEGDLRPLNNVVESWIRTLMFMTRPKFAELWDGATSQDGPRHSIEDIRRRRARRQA